MASWNDGRHQQFNPVPPHQPGGQPYYRAPVPPPPKRNNWIIGLIAGAAVLAVLVVAIVVVLAVRGGKKEPIAAPGIGVTGASGAVGTTGPVDTCLVGNWRQSQFSGPFDLSETVDAKHQSLGLVTLSGGGRTWKIAVDGSATEDFSFTRYTGTTKDGRSVIMTFTGQNTWMLKTADHKILFVSTGTTVQWNISVNGTVAEKAAVDPHSNPQPYTCTGNSWSTTSLTDTTATSRYERSSG